jgi:NAD(P)-dependent dehydrogenase (short-subunit alcohol dehydrogenase family)
MSEPTMAGKTVLITGSTGGIGFATARGLGKLGAKVILHGRDSAKADKAVAELKAAGIDASSWICDLSDLASVRRCAREFVSRHPRLDVLVNNAGGVFSGRRETPNGFEWTFAVNHLAPCLLTSELLPALKAAPRARVVNVASLAYKFGAWKMRWKDLEFKQGGYNMQVAYGQSKLANILYTVALAQRLEGSTVTANCLHPGVVASEFGRDNFFGLLIRIGRPFIKTTDQGAATSIYLASSPEVEGVSGRFFHKRWQLPLPRGKAAIEDGNRLLELSEKMIDSALS